ncbi:MAG: L-fucose:H+ symporter permease [Bacteroidaceae bacterium]
MNNKKSILHKDGVNYLVPFIMVTSCFALWGLLNNMTDNLVPAFAKIFMIDAVNSSLVQVAFYGAYAVLAIPAAIIIKKYSYRTGILVGLGFYIIGALGYIPSALLQCYELFLFSIFVLACGLSVLETTCNPFVLSLGTQETSIRRLNLAQAFNPLGSLTGIFLAKYVILAHLSDADLATRRAMAPETLESLRDTELFWVCAPYVGLVAIAIIIWCFFFRSSIPDTRADEPKLNFSESIKKLATLPRYYWGVLAQFFYIGLQISVWTWTIKYAMTIFSNENINEAAAAQYYLYAIILFIVCRWICTFLIKYINSAILLSVFAFLGVFVSICTIYLPSHLSIWFLIAISGCMSLMFPTIYGIALCNMGDEMKLGAAGLIMSIMGGAIITPIMGLTIDAGTFSSFVGCYSGAEAAVRSSFFIPVFCFVVVAIYGLCNVRNER